MPAVLVLRASAGRLDSLHVVGGGGREALREPLPLSHQLDVSHSEERVLGRQVERGAEGRTVEVGGRR